MSTTKKILGLIQSNPHKNRKQLVAFAESRGLNRNTFGVVYSKWQRGFYEDPAIEEHPTHNYNALKAVAQAFDETNDCVVKALSIVTRKPYEVVHADLVARGRVKGRGMHEKDYLPLLEEYGYELLDVQLPAKTIKTGGIELRRRYSGHMALLWVRGHIAAFDGHRIQDWSRDTKRKLYRVALVVQA